MHAILPREWITGNECLSERSNKLFCWSLLTRRKLDVVWLTKSVFDSPYKVHLSLPPSYPSVFLFLSLSLSSSEYHGKSLHAQLLPYINTLMYFPTDTSTSEEFNTPNDTRTRFITFKISLDIENNVRSKFVLALSYVIRKLGRKKSLEEFD